MRCRGSVAALALSGMASTVAAAEPVVQCARLEAETIALARIPSDMWQAMPEFSVVVRFRIEPADGKPVDVEALSVKVVARGHDSFDEASLMAVASDAIARSRFCTPAGYDRWARNRVTLRLVPFSAPQAYVQSFEPFYALRDYLDRRSGRAVGFAVFDAAGAPRDARVTESSGDAVLDAKSLGGLQSLRLITPDGAPPDRTLRLEHSFSYQLN